MTHLSPATRRIQLAKQENTFIFSDGPDEALSRITNGHLVDTKCGDAHDSKGLCCKTEAQVAGYAAAQRARPADSKLDWCCLFDDDHYVLPGNLQVGPRRKHGSTLRSLMQATTAVNRYALRANPTPRSASWSSATRPSRCTWASTS
jgi:hypothetical protein